MGPVFFPSEVAAAAVVLGHSLDSQCLSAIAEAPEGVPHKIRLAGWSAENREEMWGIRVELRWPMTMAHSAWVYWSVSQTLVGEDAARVGCLAEGVFKDLGQFALINVTREAYFVAVGPRARAALQAVADAERRYDPRNFDEDGYFRPMPAQHAADDPAEEVEAAG